jgi:transketolase
MVNSSDSIDYASFARQVRIETLKMIYRARASHIGGAFSITDLLTVLYNGVLNVDPANPDNPQRDRFILSKGHACTALYVTLAIKNFFPLDALQTYGQDNSPFICHASHKVSGIEFSTGSLGHALPVACGMAVAARTRKENWKTYCLLSDGELDEGSNWESILFAAHHLLNNLIVIVDYNKIQAFGNTNEVINLEPLQEKIRSFGWLPMEIDGHNYQQIEQALLTKNEKPMMIIAHTIKGKGVDFMENNLLWHYRSPDTAQFTEAFKQLS